MITLSKLEDQLIELMREGRARGETPHFTILKALQKIVPSPDDPELLAALYMDCPNTLNQASDKGGVVSELLYHNVRIHLTDWAKHWVDVKDEHDINNAVVNLNEWRD